MQNFTILTEDDFISDSLEPLINNDQTLRSNYAGPDFPIEVVPGLLYYQTETDGEGKITGNGKLYLCVNSNVQNIEDGFKLIANLNIDMATQQDLSQHVLNKANPHSVTPSQIGTYDKKTIDNLIAQLAKLDLSNVALSSFPKFTGATSSNKGTAGLVPEAQVAERQNFLRADGTWQPVKQGYESFPIGYRMDWDGDIIPEGWVEENGQILNRTDYPEGWDFAVKYGMVVTDVSWINNHIHGKFSSGDGSTTFRMPDRRNCFTRYNNTNVGVLYEQRTNAIDEVNYLFGAPGSGTGSDRIVIPTNGTWSDYISAGLMRVSSGGVVNEGMRFKTNGGETYPQHIISRSIRKMK